MPLSAKAASSRANGDRTKVRQALSRVHDDDYGVCEDCGAGIPFDRLRLNPQATRCVACQDTFERQHGGLTHATL
mgnify:CR=1 FL=1